MSTFDQAQIALKQKEYKKAKKLFDQALQEGADKAFTLQGLAESTYHLHKYNDAFQYANESLTFNPELARSHLILSYIYARKSSYEQSILAVQKALSIEPKDIDILAFLGSLLITQNKIPEAWDYIQQVLKLDNSNWIAHYNSGLIYREAAHKSSLKAYQNAIDEFCFSFRAKPSVRTFIRLVECYNLRYLWWGLLIPLLLFVISAWIPQIWWLFLLPFSLQLLVVVVRFILERGKRDLLLIVCVPAIMFWLAWLIHR